MVMSIAAVFLSGCSDNSSINPADTTSSSSTPPSPAPGGAGIPSGAVLPFDLQSCPDGWSPFDAGQGRFIVGAGSAGGQSYALGQTGGEAFHKLTVAEMPSHQHGVGQIFSNVAGMNANGEGAFAGGGTMIMSGAAGGDQPHETRPPYITLLYCRKN
jgi:hypothetical protein